MSITDGLASLAGSWGPPALCPSSATTAWSDCAISRLSVLPSTVRNLSLPAKSQTLRPHNRLIPCARVGRSRKISDKFWQSSGSVPRLLLRRGKLPMFLTATSQSGFGRKNRKKKTWRIADRVSRWFLTKKKVPYQFKLILLTSPLPARGV